MLGTQLELLSGRPRNGDLTEGTMSPEVGFESLEPGTNPSVLSLLPDCDCICELCFSRYAYLQTPFPNVMALDSCHSGAVSSMQTIAS